jgi:WhiB family transcriptional regulator, redox-sensing transcriptional regulator
MLDVLHVEAPDRDARPRTGPRPARPQTRVVMQIPAGVERGWRKLAACRDEDPELFFPIGDTHAAREQTEEAKAVCQRCDAVKSCLAWAFESGQQHGVWGGMSESERRVLKRRAMRAAGKAAA